ncbi:hypothetical protein L0F63_005514, partial [Massospora cicadina]
AIDYEFQTIVNRLRREFISEPNRLHPFIEFKLTFDAEVNFESWGETSFHPRHSKLRLFNTFSFTRSPDTNTEGSNNLFEKDAAVLKAKDANASLDSDGVPLVQLPSAKKRVQRAREKPSNLGLLDLEKLRPQLIFREASDAPSLSKLPAIPAAQWESGAVAEDAGDVFSAGDALLLANVYPGATYFLDRLVDHLAHSTKSSILSFNVHDLQSMEFVSKAFPAALTHRFPFILTRGAFTSYIQMRDENEEEEVEEEEDDENYESATPKACAIYSGDMSGLVSFLSSERPFFTLTAEELSSVRRLRKGFFQLFNEASWKSDVEEGGLVVHFRDAISSLLDRAGHAVIRGLYLAIQDYRLASGRKVALVVTVSPSFLNPLILKNHSLRDLLRRFLGDIARSEWARYFTLVNVHPHLHNPTALVTALEPEGATAISAALWHQELDVAYRRRVLETNLKNLFGFCRMRGVELRVEHETKDEASSDRGWAGPLADRIWPKEQLISLSSSLIGYASELGVPLDRAALVRCLEFVTFPDFDADPNSGPVSLPVLVPDPLSLDEGDKQLAVVIDPQTPSKLELARRMCDNYERKLLGCVVDPDRMTVGFEDVRVAPQTVATLQNLITLPLMRPAWFDTGVLARHFISGVLLFGPPGTGKTLLAKAVAKESGSTVLEIKGSDVYNKYVGEGEQAVRAIFRLARRLTPCVVFIDEVDALFGSRRNDASSSCRRDIINQFMLEWDGLTSANRGIMIMAATNRPFDLDDAILRRLPRRILVDLPTTEDRRHILQLHLRGEALAEDVCLATLATKTEGYSGSDLKNLCVCAAVAALQDLVRAELGASPEEKVIDFKKLAQFTGGDTLRVLTSAHFAAALSQVTASISDEMGSVFELRKWDKQFGDGARARSKRVAFGFGTPPSTAAPSP